MNYLYYDLVGWLSVDFNEQAITNISFCSKVCSPKKTTVLPPIVQQLSDELEAYFSGQLKTFTVPVLPEGTPFQQSVWQALQVIPYGQTWSYKMVAEYIGSPQSVRAVGNANNRNPLPIIVPCHRVIGIRGNLVGYAGGLEIKNALLTLEQKFMI